MDFTSFRSAIEALHPFYSLLGEAAATLLGLLFVSVTFNPTILQSSSGAVQRRSAENIFRQFVFLVWLSLLMLLPMTPAELGWSLLAQSVCFLIWIFFGFWRDLRMPDISKDRIWWRSHFTNFAVYLGAAWAGCVLLGWSANISDSFSFLIAVSFLSLFSALYGVWRLMVSSRQNKTIVSAIPSPFRVPPDVLVIQQVGSSQQYTFVMVEQ